MDQTRFVTPTIGQLSGESGRIPCPVGNEQFESQPGMLLLTPPDVVHAELDILLLRTQEQPWQSEAIRIVREAERLMAEHFTSPLTIMGIARELPVLCELGKGGGRLKETEGNR
jgi:hypothetical protein